MEAHAVGDHQHAVLPPRLLDHFDAFTLGEGHGFFDHHVFARAETVEGDRVMEVVGYDDEGGVYVIENPVVVLLDDGITAEEVGDGLRTVTLNVDHGRDLDSIQHLTEAGGVGSGHASTADDSDACLAHSFS